jgi:hypothetical protein
MLQRELESRVPLVLPIYARAVFCCVDPTAAGEWDGDSSPWRDRMSRYSRVAAAVLTCCGAGPGIAAEDRPECFSKYTKTNICDCARTAQAHAAPMLPMRLNAQV